MPIKTYTRKYFSPKKLRLNRVPPLKRLPNNPVLGQNYVDHMAFDSADLPPKVDLRPDMTPIEQKSEVGSW